MEDIKQIGLNIWGLKGGKSCFCHSENLDVKAPEIERTWLDIREFVYVSDLTVRFYALEFTPNYKVFTLYRPVNDTGRTGAYYAVTIYVPHALKVNRILDLLRQISDAYYKDHYDAFGNPNTNPDYVQVYLELIKNYAGNIVKENEVRAWEGSAQNNTPRIMPFTTIATVEQFFDKPYRKEFLQYQEVMFWDVDCLQNQQSRGVKFQKPETLSTLLDTDGKNIAPQFEGGAVRNAPEGCTIERFEREGIDITQNWKSCFFYDKTNVAVALKKPFHQPLTYRGPMIGVGSPFVKHGDDYGFSARLDFRPSHYEIPVNVANVGNTPFDLYFGSQRVAISGGRGTFGFDGSQANNAYKVTIKPDGMTEFKVGDILLSKFFVAGSDEPNHLQPCVVDNLKVFKFLFNQDCKGRLNLRWTQASVNFSTVNKVFEIVLTSEKNASDFLIEVVGYKAEVKTNDNTTFEVTLTKQSVNVEIAVPEALKRYLFPDSIVLAAGGNTYKGYKATLPLEENGGDLRLGVAVDNKGHVIDCEYDKRPYGDVVTLVPKLALLQNGTEKTLRLMTRNTTFEVFGNTTIVVPATFEAKLLNDADKYEVKMQSDGEGVRRAVITAKSAAAPVVSDSPSGIISSGAENKDNSQGNSTTSGHQGGNSGGEKANRPYVGKYRFEGKEYNLYSDNCKAIEIGAFVFQINGHQCVLCYDDKRIPLVEKQKKYDAANEAHGLRVTAKKEYCIVEVIPQVNKPIGKAQTEGNGSKGNKGGNKDSKGNGGTGNGKKRWILFGGLAIALLCGFAGLGIGLGWFKGNDKKPVYVIKIEMNNETKIDTVKADYLGRPKDYISLKDFHYGNNNATIDLYKDWAGVDIIIETVGEGVCEKISIESKVEPTSQTNYTIKKEEKSIIIHVTSPAWNEINLIQANINSTDSTLPMDSLEAINAYAKVATKYPDATSIRKKCVKKAFELVNKCNSKSIDTFVKAFDTVGVAKKQLDELKNVKANIEAAAKAAAEEERRRTQNLNNFEKSFNLVRSTKCSEKSLSTLETDYKKVQDDIELLNVIKKLTGNKKITDVTWVEIDFIPKQKKVLYLLTQSNKTSSDVLKDYTQKDKGGNYIHKDLFSIEQLYAMEKMKANFDEYWENRPPENNQTFYDFINKQK